MKWNIFPWISSRVYNIVENGCKLSRAYIYNSKRHEYITFEDNAADLWNFVLNSDEEGLLHYAREFDLLDELEVFFTQLELMYLVSSDRNVIESKNRKIEFTDEDKKSMSKFQDDMYDCIYKNGFLPSLFIETTRKCNLKCIHCYNDRKERNKKKELSFEEIKPVIDDAIKLGVFSITLSGGECTLIKDFLKIVQYIKKQKISLTIFTNGQSLYDNSDLYNSLLAFYPEKISLSLYSMKPEIHDKITGVKGSHYKTLSIIKRLKEDNIAIEVKCFLTKYNYDDYEEMKKLSKELGVAVSFDMTLLLDNSHSNKNVALSEQQIFDMYSRKDGIFMNENYQPFSFNNKNSEQLLCKGGHYFFAVSPDLELYPCISLKEKIGDLTQCSLIDIVKDETEGSPLFKYRLIRRRDLKECYNEEYCEHCSFCMGFASVENGYLNKSETCCKHAKARWQVYNSK